MSDAQYKVLMIDDEPEISGFFAKVFANIKHIHFISSSRALEGVEIARKERPAIILLDLRMPGMNGEEALRILKNELAETKFILMTGWEDGDTRERMEQDERVAAFYSKPINLEEVVTKIINLLMVKS